MNVVIAALLQYFDTYLHIFVGLLFGRTNTYFIRFDIEKALDKTNIFVTNVTTLPPITQRFVRNNIIITHANIHFINQNLF